MPVIQVMMKAIASMIPAVDFQNRDRRETQTEGLPVRSASDKTIFMRRLGPRHTIESARVTAPATSNKKFRAAQTPINVLETILFGRR